ncbi:MAG: hypothetical protein GXO75_07155 [Calditrichaeota bacterium]|nr:hypothetical protein [Calditrichota bacterium]
MSRFISIILMVLSLTMLLIVCSKNKDILQPAALQKFADISLQKAQSLALQRVKGKIAASHLEIDNGLLVYRFQIQRPEGQMQTICIDAKNGSFISEKKLSAGQNFEKKNKEKPGLQKHMDRIKEMFTKGNTNPIVGTISVTKDTDLATLAKVGEIEAQDAAVSLVEGKVENVRLENEDGYLIYVVQVRYEGNIYDVLVDAGDNKVLEVDLKN